MVTSKYVFVMLWVFFEPMYFQCNVIHWSKTFCLRGLNCDNTLTYTETCVWPLPEFIYTELLVVIIHFLSLLGFHFHFFIFHLVSSSLFLRPTHKHLNNVKWATPTGNFQVMLILRASYICLHLCKRTKQQEWSIKNLWIVITYNVEICSVLMSGGDNAEWANSWNSSGLLTKKSIMS